MSLEPFIQIETQNEAETYPGYEKTPFLLAGSEWAKTVVEKFRKSPRRVPVFLESLECKSVFICRYLTPMKPPPRIFVPGRADADKAPERAARYVSLIPWVGDSHLFKDMPDLTCLSQEFLDLGMGDSEEHAILLCNMFNYIDRQSGAQEPGDEEGGRHSYIVYGQAIPDGDCWYVARRDAKSYVELWDPRTAECYVFAQSAAGGRRGANAAGTGKRPHDPLCPLKKIWAIVGQENVWANVQQAEAPALMRFDLNDKNCWAPFLDEKRRTFFPGKVQDDRKWQTNAPDLKYAVQADREKVRRLE
jgi:coiled-coil and C2 domain-containing protein 2A